jgi:hypothetical protein
MSPSTPSASLPLSSQSSALSPAEIANHLREILKPTKQRRRIFADGAETSQQRRDAVADSRMNVDEQQHQVSTSDNFSSPLTPT